MMMRGEQKDALRDAMLRAKASSMREPRLAPAELIWWRAQLRRRQAAMEKLAAPTRGVQAFTAALVLVLAVVIAVAGWSSWSHPSALPVSGAAIAAVAMVLLLMAVLLYFTLARE